MDLSKETVADIVQIVGEAEAWRPLVKKIIETLKSFGPEIEEIPKKFSQWLVDNRIESIKRYEAAGFTREDAITMTLDESFAIKRITDKIGTSKKS